MSAEWKPQTDDSWLSAPLAFLTGCVLRAPRSVLVLAVVFALAALAISAKNLGFHTSRLDLLNPDSNYNKLWLEYLDEFGQSDDVVVVVQGDSRERVVAALDDMAELLSEEDRYFHCVLHQIDLQRVRAKGLHYLDVDQLQQLEQSLDEIDPVLNGDWSLVRLDHQLRSSAVALSSPEGASAAKRSSAHLERLSHSLAASLNATDNAYVSPLAIAHQDQGSAQAISDLLVSQEGRMLANDGRLGFVLLRLVEDQQQTLDPTSEPIRRLRGLIDQTEARHSGVDIGLTGLPVMENDEMQASQSDMLRAGVISLFGVGCIFMAGLGGIRHPLLTVAALLLAMAWSFGYITLAVGHLNILSVAFGVILIGLGIDFGVHYVARYLELRGNQLDSAQALVTTSRTVGPGVLVGAVTTAIAFFAAYFTKFTGIAELGVIAGGGILLCLAAALIVLPALIYLADFRSTAPSPPQPLQINRCINPLLRFPAATLFLAVLLTGILSAGIGRLHYDHNLLNLQPVGMESVELEQMLLDETDHSVWYAISIARSHEELLARKSQFENLPSVERTEEIVSLLPAGAQQKTPIIARIHRRLAYLPEQPPMIPVATPEDITRELSATGVALSGDDPRDRATQHRLSTVADRLLGMSDREAYQHNSQFQQQMASDLLTRLHTLRSVSQPEAPSLEDLPQSLVTRFVGRNQHYLLKVYGHGNIWDMETLQSFVQEVKQVDAKATGQPLQTYYASHQMRRSYINAALYALVAVTLVLLLDFRSISMTLLALVPIGAGLVQMFGLLGLLGISLNPANMIVLPLILGIGLDDGVHVVHDFRRRRRGYRMSVSTATAVVITSLTTMIGFGSLMISSHRGLQSLGRVLTIGVTCCMVSSLVLLPALLRWISNAETTTSEQNESVNETPSAEIPPELAEPNTSEIIQPRRRAA